MYDTLFTVDIEFSNETDDQLIQCQLSVWDLNNSSILSKFLSRDPETTAPSSDFNQSFLE
jgi:hypothetical protein